MTLGRATTLTMLGGLWLWIALQAPAANARDTATTMLGNDVFQAGSEVRLPEGSAGDAFLAGGWIATGGAVHGDEVATGGQLNLDADVDGGLTIGGGEVAVNGQVGKYLQVGAGHTRLDAHVAGNVDVASGELTVGPDAIIDGVLTYYGPQPAAIDSGAQIRGGTHYVARKHWDRAGHHRAFGAGAWIWLAGWIIAGSILLALWPGFAHTVGEVARRNPGLVLLLGFAVLICVPVALLCLMITIIGIPLALLLLFLYLLLLPVGYLAAAAALGEWLLARSRGGVQPRPRDRILMLIAVLVVLFLLTRIPLLGPALRFVLIIAGIGSLVMASALRHRGETATATTT